MTPKPLVPPEDIKPLHDGMVKWLEDKGLRISDLSDSIHGLLFEIVDHAKFYKTQERKNNDTTIS